MTVDIKTEQNAVWGDITYSGILSVGQTINIPVSYDDPNGDSDQQVFSVYYLLDDAGNRTRVGTLETILPEHAIHKWETIPITYSFDVENSFPFFGWDTFSSSFKDKTRSAIEAWENLTNFDFIESDAIFPSADVYIGFDTLGSDGRGGILGYEQAFQETTLNFDQNLLEPKYGEFARLGMDPADTNLFDYTMLHELGHVIGIGHIDNFPSIMNTFANAPLSRQTIQHKDIEVVQNLYSDSGVPLLKLQRLCF